MAEIINMTDWLRSKVGESAKPTHPIFRRNFCIKCDTGRRPCVRNQPNRCEYPMLRGSVMRLRDGVLVDIEE